MAINIYQFENLTNDSEFWLQKLKLDPNSAVKYQHFGKNYSKFDQIKKCQLIKGECIDYKRTSIYSLAATKMIIKNLKSVLLTGINTQKHNMKSRQSAVTSAESVSD